KAHFVGGLDESEALDGILAVAEDIWREDVAGRNAPFEGIHTSEDLAAIVSGQSDGPDRSGLLAEVQLVSIGDVRAAIRQVDGSPTISPGTRLPPVGRKPRQKTPPPAVSPGRAGQHPLQPRPPSGGRSSRGRPRRRCSRVWAPRIAASQP